MSTSSGFLRGNANTDECEPLFTLYRECLGVCSIRQPFELPLAHLQPQKALKSRGIEKMLDDAREDSRETDQDYLKKGCRYPEFPSFPLSRLTFRSRTLL